jgi:hypothetical protein
MDARDMDARDMTHVAHHRESQTCLLGVGEVRALVRNITRARLLLNCSACNASDGIFVGDVTDPATMTAAFDGVDTVAIAVGVGGGASASLQKAVEFSGVENQVTALTHNRTAADVGALRVVFCSSMGTTNPHPPSFEGGPVLFWKLNAEAFRKFGRRVDHCQTVRPHGPCRRARCARRRPRRPSP